MRTVVCGSRDAPIDWRHVRAAFSEACDWLPTAILSGGSGSADLAGEEFARRSGLPLERFPPDWRAHGRAAGPIRNREMGESCDAVLAFWDGKSRGTHDMIRRAERLGRRVHVVTYGEV